MATRKSPTFDPRRAEPGETFEFADGAGTLHTFSADDGGVIHPKNAMEAAVADSRGLPVARPAKSSTTSKPRKRSTKKAPAAAAPATTETADEPRES